MEMTNTLLLAEFYTASGYLDRLLFAFTEIERLHYGPRGKNQIQKLLNDTHVYISQEFREFQLETTSYDWSEFKTRIKDHQLFVETLIKLPYKSSRLEKTIIGFINLIYRNCFEIHNFIIESTNLEIQYPRQSLVQEEVISNITQKHEKPRAPLFYLDEQKLHEYVVENTKKASPLVFLDVRRGEKYDDFIHKGHLAISQNNYEAAKEHFYRARNYRETAEVLTLLAWTYSLLGDKEQAKSYCLRAIELDPQYGPAFNDFGNYILAEGQVKESLRWFELAKHAYNYQNREYPYINSGRAYVLLKDFDRALNEFSLALTIAPHHQELHETVAKLKISMEKSTSAFTNDKNGPAPLNS